ncbi:MAG: DUF4153 domain-containing protein [Peptococcaceae bacterium]|nr:DUF4153 domain-containing protein [Peptococcaceae bacterium]
MAMKELIFDVIEAVKDSIERFMSSYLYTFIFFFASAFSIINEPMYGSAAQNIYPRVIGASVFGILLCTLGKLLYERYGETLPFKYKRVMFEAVLILLSGLSYFPLKDVSENTYILMGFFGITAALFLGILYLTIADNISKTFSHIFTKTIFNGVVCGIVTLGTLLCIFAFHTLIYEFHAVHKIIIVCMLFIWIIVFLSLSLSIIPRQNAGLKTPALFKTIVLYVAFPLYMVLAAVLYIYLGKVLMTMRFPSGQINWFASFASLFFVFFIFSLSQFREENKLVRLSVEFGGYIMIPILVAQFMGIVIRLSNYGLTTARFLSVALNALALVFIIVTLIKNCRYIKHMLLVGAGVSLLLTLTPLNVLDVPMRDQTSRLMTLLDRNNMIEDGKIIPNAHVPMEDRIAITSAYYYLVNSSAKKPDIIENPIKKIHGFSDILGFSPAYEGFTYDYDQYDAFTKYGDPAQYDDLAQYDDYPKDAVSVHYSQSYINFSIYGYRMFYNFSNMSPISEWSYYKDGILTINSVGNGDDIVFDLKGAAETLYQEHGQVYTEITMEFDVGEEKLILTHVTFIIDKDNTVIDVVSYSGYYLRKDYR